MKKFIFIVLLLLVAGYFIRREVKGVPVEYSTDPKSKEFEEEFRYGSIGSDAGGLPYKIWHVLPVLFPEYLPDKGAGGENYASLGLIYEPGRTQPIGMSLRKGFVDTVGLNCAVCHTGTWRRTEYSPANAISGMPAHQFDIGGYFNYLFRCVNDPRFNKAEVSEAIKKLDGLTVLDRLLMGFVVDLTKKELNEQKEKLAFLNENGRPPMGPGRVDTFNPYKSIYFEADMKEDESIGVVDFPGIWEQEIKKNLYMHWDGNNNSIDERNISASLGAGAKPKTVDLDRVNRIRDWLMQLPHPEYPFEIDNTLAGRGRAVYDQHCAGCHEPGQEGFGQVDPLVNLKTDSRRVEAFNGSLKPGEKWIGEGRHRDLVDQDGKVKLAIAMNTLGEGYPWKFTHFRTTDGYVNRPLEGIWARAPYLHNGSVPSLRALLDSKRPAEFYRGCDVYDPRNVGFVSQETFAGRPMSQYNTALPGNSSSGHAGARYGTELSENDKNALVEYLKTK